MRAVVCLSGGQDSTTILGKALHDGFECFAIGFDYGQRHRIELEQAAKIAAALNVPYQVLDIKSFGKLVTSALARQEGTFGVPHERMASVPSSFVPNRNAVILTLAHAYTQEVGAEVVFGGMCETDYSGYPDCREVFINSLENALNIGYLTKIKFITPLMHLNKAATFKMAEECGVLDLVIEESHTCYNGVRNDKADDTGRGFVSVPRFEWGHGCGECPACELRAKGWDEYKAMEHIAEGRVTGTVE
jgi:7-cyano-7-deazaguanine synthase